MKISGGRDYIKFDLENGYVIKACGELLAGKEFVVEVQSMKKWEAPHEKEEISPEQIKEIIHEVNLITNEKTMHLIFE